MFAIKKTFFPLALSHSQRCAATTAAMSPQPNSSAMLDFEDYRAVFRHKTTWELVRGLLILRVCSVNAFVDNSLAVMRGSRALLGSRLFSAFVRPTFYRQFVGGDTGAELKNTADRLSKSGLRLMVCPVQEEDVGEAGADIAGAEAKYDSNKAYIVDAARVMAATGSETPNLQFKVTAFMSGDLVTKLASIVTEGRRTMEEVALSVASAMDGGDDLSELRGLLSDEELGQLQRGSARLLEFGLEGKALGLKLLCDAEYTYMNPGISAVVIAMAKHLNQEQPTVSNTYQCYLKAALDTVRAEKHLVEDRLGLKFGAKIVRGAYMEKERRLAADRGQPDPVNDTYEATGEMYNRVIGHLLGSNSPELPYVVVATHNEKGVWHAADIVQSKGIDPRGGRIVFGQIYGMGEQISLPLAAAGFTVYKSVPYGPLDEVLPYLSRRAAENRVVLSGARKELQLISAELKRRVLMRA